LPLYRASAISLIPGERIEIEKEFVVRNEKETCKEVADEKSPRIEWGRRGKGVLQFDITAQRAELRY